MNETRAGTWQAWIEPIGDDPEALSAADIARTRLAAGARLGDLRRARLIEISGSARDRGGVEALLHDSALIYNPHKERCHVRRDAAEPVPGAPPDTRLLLVTERGRTRRPAIERWWSRAARERVTAREGMVWALRFEAGADAESMSRELGTLRDPRHGLFCNPFAQAMDASGARAPVPWIGDEDDRAGRGVTR